MRIFKKISLITLILALLVVTSSPIKQAKASSIPRSTITNVRTGLQLHVDANNKLAYWYDPFNTSNQWDFVQYGRAPMTFVIMNVRTGLQLHMAADNHLGLTIDSSNPSNQWLLSLNSDGTSYNITNYRTFLDLHMDANNQIVGFNDINNPSNKWYLSGF